MRVDPLYFKGYEIRSKLLTRTGKWHASVAIARDEFRRLEAYFTEIALRYDVESLEKEFSKLSWEPFASPGSPGSVNTQPG